MKKVRNLFLLAMLAIVFLTATPAAAQSGYDPIDPDPVSCVESLDAEEIKDLRMLMYPRMSKDQIEAMKDELTDNEVLSVRRKLQALRLIKVYSDEAEQENTDLTCPEVQAVRNRLEVIQQQMSDRANYKRLSRLYGGNRNQQAAKPDSEKPAEQPSAVVVRHGRPGVAIPIVSDDALARQEAQNAQRQRQLQIAQRQLLVQRRLNQLPEDPSYYVPASQGNGQDISSVQPRQPAQSTANLQPTEGLYDEPPAPLVYWNDTSNVNFNVDNPEAGSYMKEEGEVEDIIDPEHKENEGDDHTVYRRTRTVDKTYRFGRE
ncbi:hypothetical protein HN958_03890 [Candidatus Falkowbacteria bacterium]|nr:hypothetical protein [Candidatus Falkowbacteria bacterium]MBT7913780.1 hypothetical protein [Candidatus Bathyarchaeota archaeon]